MVRFYNLLILWIVFKDDGFFISFAEGFPYKNTKVLGGNFLRFWWVWWRSSRRIQRTLPVSIWGRDSVLHAI